MKQLFAKKSLSAIMVMCAILTSYTCLGQTINVENYPSGSIQHLRYCTTLTQSVQLIAPTCVVDNEWIMPGPEMNDTDRVIINPTNQGHVIFTCFVTGFTVDFYIYFDTPVYMPACMAHDTAMCKTSFSWQLNAENNPTGHISAYEWKFNGTVVSTQRLYTATQFGTYTVQITDSCGSESYSMDITYSNPEKPNLGPDITSCFSTGGVPIDANAVNAASYAWSTGATGATVSTINVNTTGTYSVYVVNTNGCNGADTIHVTVLIPPTEQICFVEFDTVTWRNNVNWTATLPANVDSIHIFKETSLGVWTKIGNVPKTVHNFLDMSSNPQSQSYSYKLSTVDTCGNESFLSSAHTTITLLSAYDQGTDTYGFTWSAYGGLTVPDYNLYGIDLSGSVTQVGTVPGNQYFYNYLHPNPGFVKYFVGFISPDCSSKDNILVKSNWIQSDITGIQNYEIRNIYIYTTPDNIIINGDIANFEVSLLDITGQTVLTAKNIKTVSTQSLSKGLYIVSVKTPNHTYTQKIVKL